ncbi:MAG: rod shape-determining protein MreD [Phototrophicaceae bacterium]
MGRSFSVALVLLLFGALLNSSAIPHLRIQGGGADIVLVILSIWIVGATLQESIMWAFVGGMLQDLLSLYPLGSTSLGYIMMVFLLDRILDTVRLPHWLGMVICVVLATLIKETMLVVVGLLVGLATQLDRAFLNMLFITLLYNVALSLIAYPIVRMLQIQLTPHSVNLQR